MFRSFSTTWSLILSTICAHWSHLLQTNFLPFKAPFIHVLIILQSEILFENILIVRIPPYVGWFGGNTVNQAAKNATPFLKILFFFRFSPRPKRSPLNLIVQSWNPFQKENFPNKVANIKFLHHTPRQESFGRNDNNIVSYYVRYMACVA